MISYLRYMAAGGHTGNNLLCKNCIAILLFKVLVD